MSLVSLFRKYDRKLRKYCKEQAVKGSEGVTALWVQDNYRLCSSPFKAAVRFLSSEGEKELTPLFLLCKELFLSGKEINESRITAKLQPEKLNIKQCEAVSVLLYAACSAVICDNLYPGNDALIPVLIKNLIKLNSIDFDTVIYDISIAERLLYEDPSGIYEKSDSRTKRMYRKAVSKGAKRTEKKESEYLKEILCKCREADEDKNHIGFYLTFQKDPSLYGKLFILTEWIISLSVSAFIGFMSGTLLYVPVILLPVFAIIKPVTDYVSSRIFPSFFLPRISEENVTEGNTLITVSMLMPPASKAEKLFSHISSLYTCDSLKNVKLLMLCDKRSSKSPEEISDETDIEALKRLTDSLNSYHGGGFSFAVRDRVFSPTENEYSGFERKRGAVTALAKFLRDKNSEVFSCVYGDTENIWNMKYILALDADTELSFDALRKLLAAAVHPLNRVRYDSMKKKVVSGYGIFVPRTEVSAESASKSLFAKIFTNAGSAAYVPMVHERYSDMFSRGIFCGKGLIDIDAFNTLCADSFDEQRILSHDILEGAVLGTAFIAESGFSDAFPSTSDGYFSRAHRWIRGDVQNLKYIFRPLGRGKTAPSLPKLGKYQLADNLRRAVTPVNIFFLMIASCFSLSPLREIFIFVATLALVSEFLFPVALSLINGGIKSFSSLYFSSELSSAQKNILRSVLTVGSIVQSAFNSADAIIRALYRSIVSKKHLLQWIAAADSDSVASKNILRNIILPSLTFFVFFLYGTYLHRLFALFILIFMPLQYFFGKITPVMQKKELTENESRILLSFAAASWKFFSENVKAEENYLPPDNIQETPVPSRAARTSPTNIGMYLVSILAAADLSFITAREMYERIEKTLNSVERLPKYEGLLYNWYDTKRLSVLSPAYVSSVDCGNFLVCLTALKQGLKEYSEKSSSAKRLVERICKIIEDSDLTVLYDKRRRLFRIGKDTENGKLSDSYYDLYMSEARMTSYYACAKRQVPSEHWAALDRTLKRTSGYVAAASWTGTMFEYFMPALFLETNPGTFQYEALKVCLFLQKKSAEKRKIPYGVSESCFYETDNSLNYKYKAHGIKSLALKRDCDDEAVVSPYSVFLSLPFDVKSALKAFSELSALHCEGKYGFYEAVDFTKERTDGEHYCIVRSYMSHHIGMSITAIANTLLGNIFVKRFMSDRDMSAAKSLLNEKIPEHPSVTEFPDVSSSFGDKNTRRSFESRFAFSEEEEALSYSNGEVTVFCDKYGRNRPVFAAKELYKFSRRSEGLSVGVSSGETIVPLFPEKNGNVTLRKYALVAQKKLNEADVTAALCVHPSVNAVLVPVKIVNDKDSELKIRVYYYLEPSLLPFGKEDPHPAFSDMFLEASYEEKNRLLLFSRNNTADAPFLAVGFCGKQKMHYSLDRESVLRRNIDRSGAFDEGFCINDKTARGINPVAAIYTDIVVPSGGKKECVLVLAVSSSRFQAVHTLMNLRNSVLPDITKCGTAVFLRDKVTFPEMCNFITRVYFGGRYPEKAEAAKTCVDKGISALWKVGISGDRPIITVFPDSDCPATLVRSYIKVYKRLAKISVRTDLVFIFRDHSEYGFAGEKELLRLIDEEGVRDALNDKNGIYIFYGNLLEEDSFASVLSHSAVIYPDEYKKSVPCIYSAYNIREMYPVSDESNRFTEHAYIINRHPSLPWSHTLSNSVFGTLITDRSIGYTWAQNSRQNKLTSWSNDTAGDISGERILIESDGEFFDPVKNASVLFSDSCALFVGENEDFSCAVKITVPERGMFKDISVTLKNKGKKKKNAHIMYSVSPVLSEKREYASILHVTETGKGYIIKNPLNEDYSGVMYLSSLSDDVHCYERPPFAEENTARMPTLLQKIAVASESECAVRFRMCFAKNEKAVIKMSDLAFEERKIQRVYFDTGYKAFDEFSSALLYHNTADTRLNARCGFYQCSGAFGFRDQLQDAAALIGIDNRRVRQMIFTAACAQFPEGDVLHWFHRVYKERLIYKGVRSRCSDDKLWLVWTVSAYIEATGDKDILFVELPFLYGEKLKEDENQHYGEYCLSRQKATLYHHCIYALTDAMKTGPHSLPLIGTGDWNDSFDSVGEKGQGESVWLGMFMRILCVKFAKICVLIKENKMAEHLETVAQALTAATEKAAWNGKWYIRGFYDDGTALGDEGKGPCETDLLCQAWSSLSEMPDKKKVKTALKSAFNRLYDSDSGTVRLFSPPFTAADKKAGYVNLYPPGMRENGGQYTHAAVWFLTALFKEGMTAEAEKVLYSILPSEKYRNGYGDIYKTEPYALTGDVYAAEYFRGRGGWSLYTGSSGWLLQLAKRLSEERK